MTRSVVDLREVDGGAGAICGVILDVLPSWFGIPEANEDYIETANGHLSGIASVNGDDVGITTGKQHSPDAGYDATRAFDLAYGFRPLKEFPTLWDPRPGASTHQDSLAPIVGEPAFPDATARAYRARYSDGGPLSRDRAFFAIGGCRRPCDRVNSEVGARSART